MYHFELRKTETMRRAERVVICVESPIRTPESNKENELHSPSSSSRKISKASRVPLSEQEDSNLIPSSLANELSQILAEEQEKACTPVPKPPKYGPAVQRVCFSVLSFI
jgi:hypothetical protein